MRILSAALLIPIAASCASKPSLPASPVPGVLTDMQAALMADAFLADRSPAVAPRHIKFIQPTGDGYLVAFHTSYVGDDKPPIESHLVSVKHDGDVRELMFRANQ